ncbi:hypothetical protein VTO73DRAFT_5017 [Trametes versicolor]
MILIVHSAPSPRDVGPSYPMILFHLSLNVASCDSGMAGPGTYFSYARIFLTASPYHATFAMSAYSSCAQGIHHTFVRGFGAMQHERMFPAAGS